MTATTAGERRTPLLRPLLARATRVAATIAFEAKRTARGARASVLQPAGLTLFAASAAGYDLRIGGIVAGLGCFVLNWLLTEPPPQQGRR